MKNNTSANNSLNTPQNSPQINRLRITLFVSLTVIGVLIIVAAVYGWLVWQQNKTVSPADTIPAEQTQNGTTEPDTDTDQSTGSVPILAPDKKSITVGDSVLLKIDQSEIYKFFQTESELCTTANLNNTLTRQAFCTDPMKFKAQTRFVSIYIAPDQKKIVFVIETDEQMPDKVLGIFYPDRATDQVKLLTNFYLGNAFISFSPTGTNIVYRGNCWEAKCGLYIKNAETLVELASLNNPEYVDERTENAEFLRWLTDQQVEYKIGATVQQNTF